MVDPRMILIDWLEGVELETTGLKKTKRASKRVLCMCCKKKPAAAGKRGNCPQCKNVFDYEIRKLKSEKAKKEFNDQKVAEGKIAPSRPGRRPKSNPMREVG